jgi:8-oxo-dGTP pyrophosphatase MutT (NUDIX family)
MAHDERTFTRVGGRTVYEGHILTLVVDAFRFADGTEVEREIVRSRGAVAIVAVDDEHVWLVCQPREAFEDPDSLELPAGRCDRDGEQPLAAAQRELAEEIGMAAARWTALTTYRSSVGMTDEVVHLFLAEELSAAEGEHDSGEDERIEIVRWPLTHLDEAIASNPDSKTLLGLLLYERHRAAARP